MKTPSDDRRELETIRRALHSDGLHIPESLQPERVVSRLREDGSPVPIAKRNRSRPLLTTAAAAVVVCLLILPVWNQLTQTPDHLSSESVFAPGQIMDSQNTADSAGNGVCGSMEDQTLGSTSTDGAAQPETESSVTLTATAGTSPAESGKANGTVSDVPAGTAPEAIPSMTYIQAKPFLENGALLVDLRSREDFDQSHFPEASHIPFSLLESTLPRASDGEQMVFFYSPGTETSAAVLEVLHSLGYTRIYELTNS